MQVETVLRSLVQAIVDIQRESGWQAQEINGQTCPMVDLPNFDSLNAVEVTTLVSDDLGIDVDVSEFLGAREQRPLSIDEIARAICQASRKEG